MQAPAPAQSEPTGHSDRTSAARITALDGRDRRPVAPQPPPAPALDRKDSQALAKRGLASLLQADYGSAIEDLTAAIELKPASDLFANRALAHFGKADYDRAIEDYTQAIRLSPADPELFNYRGASYAGKGDYERAIRDYDQAIRLNPRYPAAFNNRGWAYAQKGDRARAVSDYMSALKLDPEPRVREHLETALKSLDIGAAKARGR